MFKSKQRLIFIL